jgi:hypothetical protein
LPRTRCLSALPALQAVALLAPACDSTAAGPTLADLSGWTTVVPNPLNAGEDCTRACRIANVHPDSAVWVDSIALDTLVFPTGSAVGPLDTLLMLEQLGYSYPAPGTFVHVLRCFTAVGVLVCPPCTVVVN